MTNATARPRFQLRREDLFFLGMAALSVIVVGVGFARTYYLAGLFRAPVSNQLRWAVTNPFGASAPE